MLNMSQLLIFAAKRVGYELTEYLITKNSPIGRVVIANSNDTRLIRLCERNILDYEIFDENTVARIAKARQKYSWLLNLWSPHILTGRALGLAEYRLNVHPGLLPYCRGNDCAAWTIRNHLPAGVSLIEMDKRVDTGAVYAERAVPLTFPTTGGALHSSLEKAAISLFKEAWPEIQAGDLTPVAQAQGGVPFTRKETNRDRVRHESEKMKIGDLVEWALAHDFQPNSTAEIEKDGKRYALTINLSPLQFN